MPEQPAPAPGGATPPAGAWRPSHSGRDVAAGLYWLPRLLDKGRRVLAGEAAGRDLLGAYLFGVNDPADAQLLGFLGLQNDDVLAVLRREPDDAAAAAELVRLSGKTPAECAAWTARSRRLNAPFLAMMDADEGRRPPGPGTTLLKLLYNGVVMPPTYPLYRRAEARRLAGAAAAPPGPRRGLLLVAGTLVLAGLTLWRLTRRPAPARR